MAFMLFPKLPPEIRCSIFLLASQSEPRIVPIQYDEETVSYKPRIKPPAVLRVNRECRHEAMKIYHELRLGLKVNTGCYINPLRDSIYLRSNLNRSGHLRIEDVANIDTWPLSQIITTPPTDGDSHTQTIISSYTSESRAQHSTPPSPYPNHAKIIFNDLIQSPDREVIFKSFHINSRTWNVIWRYYAHQRHSLPIRLNELCLVYEEDFVPLRENFQIKSVSSHIFSAEGEPSNPLDRGKLRQYYRVATNLRATACWVNRQDKKMGRSATLEYRVCAKYVEI